MNEHLAHSRPNNAHIGDIRSWRILSLWGERCQAPLLRIRLLPCLDNQIEILRVSPRIAHKLTLIGLYRRIPIKWDFPEKFRQIRQSRAAEGFRMYSKDGNHRSRREVIKTIGKLSALGLASSTGIGSAGELMGQQVFKSTAKGGRIDVHYHFSPPSLRSGAHSSWTDRKSVV